MKQFATFIGFLIFSFSAAAFGAAYPPGQWYLALEKPSWNPPAWVFGPVWTTLYLLIAISGFLIWQRRQEPGAWPALGVFAVQMVLNGAWSWIFFGLHRPGWALVEIVFLWLSIALTILLFRRIRPVAAWLLVPYLAWVSFASVLNGVLWSLNR